MSRIVGYGEDALTLWALQHRIGEILNEFRDRTAREDCLVFYRPSFGRSGGPESAEFGEFDAIIASREKFYLIESKWDNGTRHTVGTIAIRKEQVLRHDIFTWYLIRWGLKYSNDWQRFVDEQGKDFRFKKEIAPAGSLLARNLELILDMLQKNCKSYPSENNIKNVLLFFYNAEKSKPPIKTNHTFRLIPIEYNREIKGNFVMLS